jgi:DNA replication protein DnaC
MNYLSFVQRSLILNNWGLKPLDTAQRNGVMEIMDNRNDARSTIIISQLSVDQWHQSIGDNTLGDAIFGPPST